MSNKLLVILLALVVGGIALLTMKVNATGSNGNLLINLSTNPDPPHFGSVSFIIEVKDKEGKPVDNAAVSYDLNMATMDMGAQQGKATSQGNGKYVAPGRMTMLGPWRIRAEVRLPDGTTENKDFTVNAR